jgi:hypothetical protein
MQEARERLDAAFAQDRENREDAFVDLKFLAGDQWPHSVRQAREAQNRPCLTINRLPQFVHRVANTVRQNPPAIRVIPAGGEATRELADVYTGLLRHIQHRSNATHVFAHAVHYAVACGIGHFRLTTDYVDETGFDQDVLIKRIQHPLSVFWDPAAVEPTRSDAEFCFVSELIDRKTFERRFPDASTADFDMPKDANADSGLFWSSRDAVRVCEYWVKRADTRTMARLTSGAVVDITDLGKGERAALAITAIRKVKSYRVERYLLGGSEVLEGPSPWAGRHIPIFPVIGSEVALETKTVRHGLIRFGRDPQQLYNFWRSAAAETIALAPRAPFLATPAMIAKFKGQWDTQNTVARPYLLYEPDPDAPGNRPMREPPPDIPQALVQESAIASDEMKATTGVYDAALGARSNEISGVAIRARESQGDATTLHYQDNLLATLHHLGAALLDLVPKIYDTERTIRIAGEDGEHAAVAINVPLMDADGKRILLNDLSQGVYDVRVKIGPAYATRRAETASSMIEFIQAVPQAAGVIGDLVARNMDWPGADEIADRLERLLPRDVVGAGEKQGAEAMALREAAYREALAQAELSKAESQAAKAVADAVRANAEAVKAQAEVHPHHANAIERAPGQP